MPKTSPITAPLRDALFECFRATTRLVRPELRRQLILVGGAASIAHNSIYRSEDVDVVAPKDAIIDISNKVMDGALGFSLEPDGNIAFDSSQGFRVRVDTLELGDIIKRIHVAEPFFEGSVASMSDLLRLRAETVVNRGSNGDAADFRWVLSEVARAGQILKRLSSDELECIRNAKRSYLGRLDCLVLYSVLDDQDGRTL
ncbi:hypothetical protein N7507_003797 [Penicillium longicatenatum]|nr:hypothetical protein N7507_003797 [Penicillium longicatenatum]